MESFRNEWISNVSRQAIKNGDESFFSGGSLGLRRLFPCHDLMVYFGVENVLILELLCDTYSIARICAIWHVGLLLNILFEA